MVDRSPINPERAWFDTLYVLLLLIQALHILEQWLTNAQLLEEQGLGPWLSRVLVFLAVASLPLAYRWFSGEFPVVFIIFYAAGQTAHGAYHAYSPFRSGSTSQESPAEHHL